MNETDKMVQDKIDEVWKNEILLLHPLAKPVQETPSLGVVLGGQPGAGKSGLIQRAIMESEGNIITINGDDYRKYHPDYEKFQSEDIENSAAKTAEFAGKMVEAILKRCIDNRYNVVIEGTFRTAATPIKTLTKFKNEGYNTEVMIQTCDKALSWQSCLERFEKVKRTAPNEARATRKQDHDIVVENLAKNIAEVYESGLADRFRVFGRFLDDEQNSHILEIFDSFRTQDLNSEIIQAVLDNAISPGCFIPNNQNNGLKP